MPLHLNMQVGDALEIDGGRIVIELKRRSGSDVKVSVDADRSIEVRMVPGGMKSPPAWSKGLNRSG